MGIKRRNLQVIAAANWTPELEKRRDELVTEIRNLQAEGAAAHRSMTETAVAYKRLQQKLIKYRAQGRPVDTFQSEAQELRELRNSQAADVEAISDLHLKITNLLHELQMVQRRAGAKLTPVPRDGIKSFETLRTILEQEKKNYRERSQVPDQASYYGDYEDGDDRSEALKEVKAIQRQMAAITGRMASDPANSGQYIDQLQQLSAQLEQAKKKVPASIKNSVYSDIVKINDEIEKLKKIKNERNSFFVEPQMDVLLARLAELKQEDMPIRLRRQYDMLSRQIADLKKKRAKAKYGDAYMLDLEIQTLEGLLENISKDPAFNNDPDRVRRAKIAAIRQEIAKLRQRGKKNDIMTETRIQGLEVALKNLGDDVNPPGGGGGGGVGGPSANVNEDDLYDGPTRPRSGYTAPADSDGIDALSSSRRKNLKTNRNIDSRLRRR